MTPTNPLAGKRLLMAVDLDGTFLGGSPEDRAALWDLIEAHRAQIGLIFVTGRPDDRVNCLYERPDALPERLQRSARPDPDRAPPEPDIVINYGGSKAALGRSGTMLRGLDRFFSRRWNGAGRAIEAFADREPGVSIEEKSHQYHRAFRFDPERMTRSPEAVLADLAATTGTAPVLVGGNIADIVPKGAEKGPTLHEVLRELNVPQDLQDRLITAGDSFNDIPMLTAGFRAIAVGNAKPELKQALAGRRNSVVATRPGAGGILEGLEQFEPDLMATWRSPAEKRDPRSPAEKGGPRSPTQTEGWQAATETAAVTPKDQPSRSAFRP